MAKTARSMLVIPKPAQGTRSVLVAEFVGPVIRSVGALDYVCGKCGATLLESVEFEQIQNIVVKCGACGSFNETPPANEMN